MRVALLTFPKATTKATGPVDGRHIVVVVIKTPAGAGARVAPTTNPGYRGRRGGSVPTCQRSCFSVFS